jgi:hypothetical protein
MILSLFLLTPLVLFEYFALFWIWGGNGRFNFFGIPILFLIVFTISYLVVIKNYKANRMKFFLSWCGVITIAPLISITLLYIIGFIFKVDVFNIH